MGGVVAFEMAQRLIKQGETVRLLGLIDSFAPAGSAGGEMVDQQSVLETFVEDIEGLSGTGMLISRDDLERTKGANELLALVLGRLQALDLAPAEFGLATLGKLYELYRTNLAALLQYEPRGYSGAITLFRTAASLDERDGDGTLGWSGVSNGGLEVHEVDGDHYSILSGPASATIAALLSERLGEMVF